MAVNLNVVSTYKDTGIKKATGALQGFGNSLKGLVGVASIGAGLSALASGLMDAAKAATEDVKSQALLATQLRNTVGANSMQIAGIEKTISAMQLQTSIADDQLRPALANLVRATGDANKAMDLLALSADIAAGTGKDLATVSTAVGKAAAGQTTSLFRLIPSLKGATDWAAAAKDQFAGMAETAAESDPFQRLTIIFGELQEQVGVALLPELNELADWLSSPEVQNGIGQVIQQFKDLVADFTAAADGVSVITDGINDFIALFPQLELPKAVTDAWDQFFNGFYRFGIGLGLVASILEGIGNIGKVAPEPSTGRYAALEDFLKAKKAFELANGKDPIIPGGKEIKNAVADYYANLADEIKKQRARLKLEQMGASTGLIESIIGSGKDWLKVYNDAIKGGVAGITALQQRFNQTKAGLDEIAAAEKALADAAEEAAKALAEQTQTFIDNQIAQRDAINATLDNVRALGVYRREMGEFETAATDAFDAVQASLAEAFKTGAITKNAYDNLVKYAGAEASILQSIGRQRDDLANKKSLVQSVIADVKEAVIGTAKLGDYVKSEASTVTETVTKMVGGIAITTSRTTEVLKTNANLVDGFKSVLAKTKTFVAQLKELRALGLTGDLFKQIVDAGAESGGATAAAIIAGGSKTVKELNGLYADIQTEAGKLAEQTAQVLYGSGIDLTNGIIAGIQAQENALITVAQDLGSRFADAFSSRVKDAVADALALFKSGGVPTITTPTITPDSVAPGIVFSGVGAVGAGNMAFKTASVGAGSQVPVQVNLTLDSKVVAQQLIKLERTSGAIWVRAQ